MSTELNGHFKETVARALIDSGFYTPRPYFPNATLNLSAAAVEIKWDSFPWAFVCLFVVHFLMLVFVVCDYKA